METHRCEQICNNTIGSYTCSCKIGYTLNANTYACDGMLSNETFSFAIHKDVVRTLQILMSASQILPMNASKSVLTLSGPILVSAILDIGWVIMETVVSVSSA